MVKKGLFQNRGTSQKYMLPRDQGRTVNDESENMDTPSSQLSSSVNGTSSPTDPAPGAYDLEIVWAWKETASQMPRHPPTSIAGSLSECWIKYDKDSNDKLETAFQSQDGEGTCDLGNGYVVDFLESKQTKTSTGYVRAVRRILNVRSSMDKTDTIWCWKESKAMMGKHDASVIYGNPSGRWIKYDANASYILESAFQTHGVSGTATPYEGYTVSFATMKQRKSSTGFERDVLRVGENDTEGTLAASQTDDTPELEIVWAWKETARQMSKHPRSSVAGDPKECWIKYDETLSAMLEAVFQSQGGEGTCDLGNGYVVDLLESKQTKKSSGYVRDVKRFATAKTEVDKCNIIWCWKESQTQMKRHSASVIFGNPTDRWIKYDDGANSILESAFQAQGTTGKVSPCNGYMVNFSTMKQIKASTGYEREVQRVDGNVQASPSATIPSSPPGAATSSARLSNHRANSSSNGLSSDAARSVADKPKIWCWRESKTTMGKHAASAVHGDPSDRWIKYDDTANALLESAYQVQGVKGTASPCEGYIVDFGTMKQTNISTGYERKVQRVDHENDTVNATKSQTPQTDADAKEIAKDDACDNGTDSHHFGNNDNTDPNDTAPLKPKVKAAVSKAKARFYHALKRSRTKYLPFGAIETMSQRDSIVEDHHDMPVHKAKNITARQEMKKAIGWWSANQHYKPAHVKKLEGDVKRAVKLNRNLERYRSSEILPIGNNKIRVIERPPKRLERNGTIRPNPEIVADREHQESIFKELDVSEKLLGWLLSVPPDSASSSSSSSSSNSSSTSSSSYEVNSDASDESNSDSDDSFIQVAADEECHVSAGVGADFRPEDCPDLMTLMMRRQHYSLRP